MSATRRRRFTLTAAVLVTVMTVLDFNVVSVAMPDILDSFPGSTLPQASWILNGYSVMFAAALLPSGTLADRWGTPRLFTIGVLVFAGGSLLCALAPGLWWLVLARGVQAVGGGALVTTNIAMGLAALP
ncbi:MAG: MFS transporter, partial [Actinocatenispora sp.]